VEIPGDPGANAKHKRGNKMKHKIIKTLEANRANSAWSRGVKSFAIDLVNDCEGELTEENMLNGAENWNQYSTGGCALVYDCDIANALCTPSELKRKDHGRLPPNSYETWIDVQTRALYQSCILIKRAQRICKR
jgi:hypothetical protein